MKYVLQELIDRVLQLQAHNNQLLNILKKERVAAERAAKSERAATPPKSAKELAQRKFNFPT